MKKLKNRFKDFLNRLPYVRTLHKLNSNSKFPAGHFYSSVVSLEDIKQRQDEIWVSELEENIPGININKERQTELFHQFEKFYDEMDFPENPVPEKRYFLNNSYYAYADGIILYSFIRYLQPKKITEIGSGYSSALMLDMNQTFFQNKINLTFIEPFPEVRLQSLFKDNDITSVQLISKLVQKVPLKTFERLEKGDILFIDSSHVVKTGSDVHYILNKILPILKKGVIIHFHDIQFPFEYPKSWVLNGFGWNETYFLKAFLMYNTSFDILIFSDYLNKFHNHLFSKMPLSAKATGSSFWMEKTK
ncbi:class I SAM-dependent methyltransferase [Zunongwangia sp. H14]|uniref:class I SAM-dependent methyltransferase n=1 Tax=Zunongwangia sp. H14 TaxID=3240792 RepID=UPI003566C11C